MREFEKDAAFYRAYLTHERSLGPLTVVLATSVAIWMLFYLVGLIGPQPIRGPLATQMDKTHIELVQASGHSSGALPARR